MKTEIISHPDCEPLCPVLSASGIECSLEGDKSNATDMISVLFILLMLVLVVSVCFFKSKVFCILFFLCNWC